MLEIKLLRMLMGEWILQVRMMSDLYKANRVYADLCDCALSASSLPLLTYIS